MEIFAYCRSGFEPECAAELQAWATRHAAIAWPQAERNAGYARLKVEEEGETRGHIPTPVELIFARQSLEVFAELRGLKLDDRLGPMLEVLRARGERFGDVWTEHPDSDAARVLAGLARSFGNALRPALRKNGLLEATPDERTARLHVIFLAGDHVLLAHARAAHSAPWPMGIPRLRMSRDAPSRSALKLEEALLTLLVADERSKWLKPGMKAADLGAAPGGWSWVLARHGVHVTAIDNGPLAESALATGLIRHQRADGFSWQPPQPLDWMVCDMVEQPRRVAARMAEWFAQGWCRRAIFNLKLPMKKRYAEVQANLADFMLRCERAGVPVAWRARQLYHDREEITVFATCVARPSC